MGSIALHILTWMVLAFLLERVLLVVARDNYGAQWNGAGAISGVIQRSTQAPMIYRVLVPWLAYLLRQAGMPLLSAYELVKILLTGFALWAVELAWGPFIALGVLAFLPVTFLYDYWDWAGELLGLSLILTGDFWLALVGVWVWGLSRDTVLLAGLAFWLASGDWIGAFAVLSGSVIMFAALRLVQGNKESYCKLIWIKDNWQAIKNIRHAERPWWMGSTIVSLVLIVIALLAAWPTGAIGLMVPVLVAAGLVFGRIEETRVFTSIVPWVGYAVIRLFML